VPVIHSGDAVTLWSDEKNLRMQLAAIAEGNAAVGERVQLRVTGAGVYGNTGWRVAGIVRGPGSVEMEQ
jgi:flagella basal body P-ring formation protein FlgA